MYFMMINNFFIVIIVDIANTNINIKLPFTVKLLSGSANCSCWLGLFLKPMNCNRR